MRSKHTELNKFKCWKCDFTCASKDDLTTHNEKYWYSHRMFPNSDHKRHDLKEVEELKKDGFTVNEDTLNMVTNWKD